MHASLFHIHRLLFFSCIFNMLTTNTTLQKIGLTSNHEIYSLPSSTIISRSIAYLHLPSFRVNRIFLLPYWFISSA